MTHENQEASSFIQLMHMSVAKSLVQAVTLNPHQIYLISVTLNCKRIVLESWKHDS